MVEFDAMFTEVEFRDDAMSLRFSAHMMMAMVSQRRDQAPH